MTTGETIACESISQIVPGAPWEIDSQAIVSPVVIQAAAAAKNRESRQQRPISEGTPILPGLDEESVEGEDLP